MESIPTRGHGEKVIQIESASRPGLKHYVSLPDARHCTCEAASFGAPDCTHRRLARVRIRNERGEYHRVAERHGIYGPYFVVVDHEGRQVSGPTFSKLEAIEWCAEEDAETPLEVAS